MFFKKTYSFICQRDCTDPSVTLCWINYRNLKGRTKYSAEAAIRKKLITLPITDDQLAGFMQKCMDEIEKKAKKANCYLAAMILGTSLITLEELCALQYGDAYVLRSFAYQQISLSICRSMLLTTAARKPGRQIRARKYRCSPYSAEKRRSLPLPFQVQKCWKSYFSDRCQENSKEDQNKLYLLYDPKNPSRPMRPDLYRAWLNETFPELLNHDVHVNMNKQVTDTANVDDLIYNTALDLHERGDVEKEQIRYERGLVPQHTDATSYVGYGADCRMAAVSEQVTTELNRFLGWTEKETQTRKVVPGHPHEVSHATWEITTKEDALPEEETVIELHLAAFGGLRLASVQVVPIDQEEEETEVE